jgi:DNA repair protein RadC
MQPLFLFEDRRMKTAMEPRPRLENTDDEQTILRALLILRARFRKRDVFASPDSVKDYLRLQAQGLAYEVFAVMYLDCQNRLIDYERLFRGTLSQTSVYPREVTRQALVKNAAAVILHHNHPSGTCIPSRADEALTRSLKSALALIDVRVLDHIITSDDGALSMAEKGLL